MFQCMTKISACSSPPQEEARAGQQKDANSFRDAKGLVPEGLRAQLFPVADLDIASNRGASPGQGQAPLEERSNSIGEELKMVMKSERGGRLVRDSAELLVGDRPGEFTVITEEGST